MSSADEIAAVRAADLGAWLASIGLANVLHSMEEVGADAPHDLLYLEQEDIDSLNLSGEQQQKLLSAIGRIEDIEEGRVTQPAPAPAASAPAPAPVAAHAHEHGHLLRLHHEEVERERQRAQAEAAARSSLEQQVLELKQQMQSAFAQAAAAEEQLKSTQESTRRQLEELSSKNRQLQSATVAPSGGADAAARQAAEAKAERLAAQLREAQARPAPQPGTAAPAEPLAVVGLACRYVCSASVLPLSSSLPDRARAQLCRRGEHCRVLGQPRGGARLCHGRPARALERGRLLRPGPGRARQDVLALGRLHR